MCGALYTIEFSLKREEGRSLKNNLILIQWLILARIIKGHFFEYLEGPTGMYVYVYMYISI